MGLTALTDGASCWVMSFEQGEDPLYVDRELFLRRLCSLKVCGRPETKETFSRHRCGSMTLKTL